MLLGISELIPVGHGPFLEQRDAPGWRTVFCSGQIAPRRRARAWTLRKHNPADTEALLPAVEELRVEAVLPRWDATVGVAAVPGGAWQLLHASPCTSPRCPSRTRLKQKELLAGAPTPAFQERPGVALPSPGTAAVDLPPPWICKPIRSMSGSVSVLAAVDEAELNNGLRLHGKQDQKETLLEPLLRGSEQSVEVIVQQGRDVIRSISDKVNDPGSASVDQSQPFPARSDGAMLKHWGWRFHAWPGRCSWTMACCRSSVRSRRRIHARSSSA